MSLNPLHHLLGRPLAVRLAVCLACFFAFPIYHVSPSERR